MYFQFYPKIKVYGSLCFVSKDFFFLTWTTIGGADYQNKNGQCRVKKSKTMSVLGANTVVTLKSLLEMEEQSWILSE